MLSPQITLFYNHSLSHSSKLSGILTINAILIIIFFILFFDKDILNHDIEIPKVSWYNLCEEDSGEFSYKFFFIISFYKYSKSSSSYEEFDFTFLNLIGLDIILKIIEMTMT